MGGTDCGDNGMQETISNLKRDGIGMKSQEIVAAKHSGPARVLRADNYNPRYIYIYIIYIVDDLRTMI